MREEVQRRGEEESGLGVWYCKKYLDQNRGFAPYQHAVANFLEEFRGEFARVTEVGAGIGQGCLQLTARGWTTVGLESCSKTT